MFGYDEAGNTTTDPELFGTGRVLTWDAEGRLASVTSPAGVSEFTYTADGDRLVRRDPGTTAVYLPGGQELTTTADGRVKATRYYTAGGTTIAVRTEADDPEAFGFGHVTITVADPHGTGQLGFNTHTGELVRRYTDPYGNPLDATGAWPTDRGFLNKPVDATGYTHIGARYYNPAHGRFLSVDPIMDLTDPAQWHAYTYANNNPITYTDPTGLKPMMIDGQYGSPRAAAAAPPSTRPPTHKDQTGGYTPAGYSPRPTPDDRRGGPGTPWAYDPPVPPVVPTTLPLPPALEHFHGVSLEDIIAAIIEALEEQAVESDPVVSRGPDTYWKAELKACALVCILVGIGWDEDFDFTLGGGVGADVGGSVSVGGGLGQNEGLQITPTCTVTTPIGGVYGEVGLGEETTFFGGGGYSWGAEAGCSVEVAYTW